MKTNGQDGIRLGNIFLKCHDCKKRYDLEKACRQADNRGERDVKCPHCGAIVGKV